MSNETTYPQEVEFHLEEMVNAIQLLDLGQETPTHCIREVVGPILFDQWMQGEISGFVDGNEMLKVLQRVVVTSVLDKLQEQGLIDSIDNEDGEEMVFLTQRGKEIATDMNSITKQYMPNEK